MIRGRAIVRDTFIENIRYHLHVLAALFIAIFASDVSLHLAVGEVYLNPYSAVKTFFVTALTITMFTSDLSDMEILVRSSLVCLFFNHTNYDQLWNNISAPFINGALLTAIFFEQPAELRKCCKFLTFEVFVDLILRNGTADVAGRSIGFVSGVLCFYIFPAIDLKLGSGGEEIISSRLTDTIFLVFFSMIGRFYCLSLMLPIDQKTLSTATGHWKVSMLSYYTITPMSMGVYAWILTNMRIRTPNDMESVLPAIKRVVKAATLVIAATAVPFLVRFAESLLLFCPSYHHG